jgi:hypothetical protein
MKNIQWIKPYHYVNYPVYLINFWKIRLFKIGYKRRRVGYCKSPDEVFNLYNYLLTPKK